MNVPRNTPHILAYLSCSDSERDIIPSTHLSYHHPSLPSYSHHPLFTITMEIALPPWTTFTVSTSTNLGPLTTAISFPDDCLSKIWDFQTPGLQPPAEQSLWTYYTQGCAVASCCPNSKPYSEAYEWLTTYYSPAVCPHSYKACLGPTGFTPELAQGESTAFCCPA